MNFKERIFHAILFECLAVLLSVLVLSTLTTHGSGLLTGTMVAISLTAMLWNMLFNWIFDQFHRGAREQRSWLTRLLQVVLFEGGLLLVTVPMVAFMLDISLWQALVMDIAMTLFVMLYALIYNYLYDHIRAALLAKHQAKSSTPS